jgi:hypothetical protein
MSEEKQQMRVTTQEAFHHVAEALKKLNTRIDKSVERLNNDAEIFAAQSTLIDVLIADVKALRSALNNQAQAIETLRAMVQGPVN